MRTMSHALVMLLLLTSGCACPPPATTETPSGGGAATAPDLDPGTKPATTPPSGSPPAGGGGDRTLAVAASDPQYARVEGSTFQNACQSDGQCFVGGCSSEICTAEEGVSGTCDMPAGGWPSKGASCGCVSGQCVWYRTGGAGTAPGTGAGSGTGSGSGAGSGTGTAPGSGAGSGAGSGSGTGTAPGTGAGAGSGKGPGGKPDKGGSGGGGGGGGGAGASLPKQSENCTADYKCAAGLTCKRYRGIAGAAGPEFKTCEIPCTGKGSTCPAGQSCVTIADGPGQVCKPK